jgi:prevent-host-death family protein
VRYKVFMQTLSLTEARANLSKLCQSALDGVEVVIVHNGRLVKLQPVDEVAELSDAEALPELDKLLAARAKKTGRSLTAADRKRILSTLKR